MSKLPLISLAKTLYPHVNLNKTAIIAVQHLLGTTHDMFRSWYDRGLKPDNLYVLGKCYSSNPNVFLRLKAEGIHVSQQSFSYHSHLSYDSQFEQIVSKFVEDSLSQIKKKPMERLVLLDDGGYLINYVGNRKSAFQCPMIGIEQTASGYEIIKNLSLHFPVINVAKSPVKLKSEYPMVAELVTEKIRKTLKNHRDHVLIIGNGTMGKAIKRGLEISYHVTSYDTTEDPPYKLEEILPQVDLIVGCTGTTSLHVNKHVLLKKGCVLVSASSSDREFDAVYIRKSLQVSKNCHLNIHNGHIKLLNSGFPINFTGEEHSVAPEKIQLTRALLTLGLLQGCTELDKKGLVDLDTDHQTNLYNAFLEIHSPLESLFPNESKAQ